MIGGWSHLKEIPNTNLLVSLHCSSNEGAKMEMLGLSLRGMEKICSYERVKKGKF